MLKIEVKNIEYFLFLCFNNYVQMRILIDTNIIIGLEDNKVVDADFSEFLQYATSSDCIVYYHPDCLKDLGRDRNLMRQKIILSKVKKYKELPNPARLTDEFINEVGQKSVNDEIDNIQLFQLYSGYVELLVSEDKEILKKAKKIGLLDKVLSIKDALNKLKKKFEYIAPRHPILTHCSVREIKERIEQPFFDSLKTDYEGFDLWFEKCVRQNRDCYYITIDEKLAALLIYNIEKIEQHRIPDIFENALKMCTFKTNEDAFGLKIGELFLSKMFQLCVERGINYLYLTLFEKYKFLIGMLAKFGFKQKEFINKNNIKEIVMIKNLNKNTARLNKKLNDITMHPFYSDNSNFNKFVIPIKRVYSDTLFKDSSERQPTLFDKELSSLKEIQGNSIIKAYICNAKRKDFKPGDILFFYSSRNLKLIQPIGILDRFSSINSLEKLKAVVRGKTVFTERELEKMYKQSSGNLLVIIFRLVYYLEKPIELKTIQKLKCFSNNFITITQMGESDYIFLKKEGSFDERYIID